MPECAKRRIYDGLVSACNCQPALLHAQHYRGGRGSSLLLCGDTHPLPCPGGVSLLRRALAFFIRRTLGLIPRRRFHLTILPSVLILHVIDLLLACLLPVEDLPVDFLCGCAKIRRQPEINKTLERLTHH